MNKVQRAIMVIGAVCMVISGSSVLYQTRSGVEWGDAWTAPTGAIGIDIIPTVVWLTATAFVTASLCIAFRTRKG
jgi:hypothetical protein